MSRPIDADALIHELNNSHYPGAPYVDAGISIAIGKVCDAPTIEPETEEEAYERGYTAGQTAGLRKTGKRMYGEDNLRTGVDGWFCSECEHFEAWDYSADMKSAELNLPNFCPNCGADMRGEGEQE